MHTISYKLYDIPEDGIIPRNGDLFVGFLATSPVEFIFKISSDVKCTMTCALNTHGVLFALDDKASIPLLTTAWTQYSVVITKGDIHTIKLIYGLIDDIHVRMYIAQSKYQFHEYVITNHGIAKYTDTNIQYLEWPIFDDTINILKHLYQSYIVKKHE